MPVGFAAGARGAVKEEEVKRRRFIVEDGGFGRCVVELGDSLWASESIGKWNLVVLGWTVLEYDVVGMIGGSDTVARSIPRLDCKFGGEQAGVDFVLI